MRQKLAACQVVVDLPAQNGGYLEQVDAGQVGAQAVQGVVPWLGMALASCGDPTLGGVEDHGDPWGVDL